MEHTWLSGSNGDEISCRYRVKGEKKILLICHGFGSSQYSPTVEALHQKMPQHGIATVSFDFPAHGDSKARSETLTVERCVENLGRVEAWARTAWPGCEILHFGSSFGAYITLLYLASCAQGEKRAFLRSAAVDMYGIVCSWFGESTPVWQEENGEEYFTPDRDYARPMCITRRFLAGLQEGDVFARYPRREVRIAMIHGSCDSTAPVEAARRFARQAGAKLMEIPGGEHRLMGQGELEQVLEQAVLFFS